MFSGLSSLRKAEKKEPTVHNKALQDYLAKQYGAGSGAGGGGEQQQQEGRKKKKKKVKQTGAAVVILDHDLSGLAPVPDAPQQRAQAAAAAAAAADNSGDDDGDEPVIANPEEATALRLQVEKSKNFYAKGDDGSGWVSAAAGAGGAGSDASPPRRRRQRHDSPDGAAAAAAAGDRDLSPPRRRPRHDSPPAAAAGAGSNGVAAAVAAPRGAAVSPDLSPPRRGQQQQRHDSPDLSPPRRGQQQQQQRQQRQRHDSPQPAAAGGHAGGSPDLSPPRRPPGRRQQQQHERGGSPDLSPPRRPPRSSSRDADLSPPRRGSRQQPQRQRHDSPPDASPPRRRGDRHDRPADALPPRRRVRHDSPAPSPAAAAAAGRGDARGAAASSALGPDGKPRIMGDGTAAGLVSSRELAEEAARLRAQAEERRRLAAGRGEATVYRDKATGAVISAEEYAAQVAKSKQKKAPAEEVHVAWKGGLAQQRAAQEAAQRAAAEARKAFGRGLDAEVDHDLKRRDRWGDPMAGKLKSKKGGGDGFDLPPPVITEANRAMMEASGFSVPQEVPAHSWLRRGVPPPVNRYNLRPGRHWDGVDRSTGFEKQMFKMLNSRNAREAEARMWAQEDM